MNATTTATNVLNVATIALTTAVLAAAVVTPVKAATSSEYKARIEKSIDATMQMPASHYSKQGVATVSVRVNANGNVESAQIVGSAGSAAFDSEALRTAKTVSYPTGAPRTIVMILGFNRPVTGADRAKSVALAEQVRNDPRHLLAAETSAHPIG